MHIRLISMNLCRDVLFHGKKWRNSYWLKSYSKQMHRIQQCCFWRTGTTYRHLFVSRKTHRNSADIRRQRVNINRLCIHQMATCRFVANHGDVYCYSVTYACAAVCFVFNCVFFCLFDIPGFEVYISPDQCAVVVCLSLYCTALSFCFISQTTCSIPVSHFPVLSSFCHLLNLRKLP